MNHPMHRIPELVEALNAARARTGRAVGMTERMEKQGDAWQTVYDLSDGSAEIAKGVGYDAVLAAVNGL